MQRSEETRRPRHGVEATSGYNDWIPRIDRADCFGGLLADFVVYENFNPLSTSRLIRYDCAMRCHRKKKNR